MLSAGILLLDKSSGRSSHDAVAMVRKVLGTRKVGHAGTLDPMATGLLLLGINGATRLLHYFVGLDKHYSATIRLGADSSTDDADGEIKIVSDASAVTLAEIDLALEASRGDISQLPSAVSAIKLQGKKAYELVREGVVPELKPRRVTISRLEVLAIRATASFCDIDVVVECSSGTYIRAIARDLGAALGVGGHLIALRRDRVGPFEVGDAFSMSQLAELSAQARSGVDLGDDPLPLIGVASAASAAMGQITVSDAQARDLRHGKIITWPAALAHEHTAAITEDGQFLGVVSKRGREGVKSVMNMPEVTS